MSTSPPRKRLKQSTIQESFERQSSKEAERSKTSSSDEQKINDSASVEDNMNEDIRAKTLKAAEQRRKHNSPEVTPTHEPQYPEDSNINSPGVLTRSKAKDKSNSPHENSEVKEKEKQETLKETADEPTVNKRIQNEECENSEKKTETNEITTIPDSEEDVETDLPKEEEPCTSSDVRPKENAESYDGAMGSAATKTYKPHYQRRTYSMDELNMSKGTNISDLNRQPMCSPILEKLVPSKYHTVLFDTRRLTAGIKPMPFPKIYEDKWDNDHVKMPCSNQNEYPSDVNGKKEVQNRWKLIEESLLSDMRSSLDIEEAIIKYNTRYAHKWDFRGMHSFFTEELTVEENQKFFDETLPNMVTLALRLPHLCTRGIPLLKQHYAHSVSMSQEQAACLLANAFFCTFPRRNAHSKTSEYSSYPEINFNSLFSDMSKGKGKRKIEKMKCIVNYFRRVTSSMPTGVVTYRRQVMRHQQQPDWENSKALFRRLHVSARGTIEDDGQGMLQVDFANKYVGGGVLGNGCVQEEIRFLLCPEMILSRLFTEVLAKDECLIMTGCERFNNYTGYADSFAWDGNHTDKNSRDDWGRLFTEVVAIDALVFHSYADQFQDWKVLRELNKAWCGFYNKSKPDNLSAVATGNWGCGAFGGDLQLKSMLQLMAAAEAGRDMCYFTFSDCEFRDELYEVHKVIVDQKLTLDGMVQIIKQYQYYLKSNRSRPMPLFTFITYHLLKNDDSGSDEGSPTRSNKKAGVSKVNQTNWEIDEDESSKPCFERSDSREMEHYDLGRLSPDYAASTP